MDIHQILKKLPHRYPFLMVDRVLEIESGKRIQALKNVTINEPFFTGHFPHRPVMPGVMMLEAMAQAAAAGSQDPERVRLIEEQGRPMALAQVLQLGHIGTRALHAEQAFAEHQQPPLAVGLAGRCQLLL